MLAELEKDIRDGRLKMKPKAYFFAKYGLILLGILLLLCLAVYIGSFILFVLRANGILLLPSLGWWGIPALLHGIPWLLVLLVGLFVIALEVAGRHLTLVHRLPLLYSALSVLGIITIGSIVIGQTRFHYRVFQTADKGRLPVIEPLYHGFGEIRLHDFRFAKLRNKKGNIWTTDGRFGEQLLIIVNDRTRFFPSEQMIVIGDRILVVGEGERREDVIHARAIRKLQPNMVPEFPRSRWGEGR